MEAQMNEMISKFDFVHACAWANNVVTTHEGLHRGNVKAEGVVHASERIAVRFQNFLLGLLCRYPCYKALHTFVS